MIRHSTVPPEASRTKRRRGPGSRVRWPLQLRITGWQQVRFVPVITQVQASVSRSRLFQTFSSNCT